MRSKNKTTLNIFAGSLLFVMFCTLDPSQNPFDPKNPNYQRPSMTFDSFPIPKDDTVSKDSLFFIARGNYRENVFRWRMEDSAFGDTTKWAEWDGKDEWTYPIQITSIKTGIHQLHVQTAYHQNSDITDSLIKFVKADIPKIIGQNDTLLKKSTAQSCTLWVKATGTSTLSYQWWYCDTGTMTGKMKEKTKDTCILSSCTISNIGHYWCIASNKWGSDTSKAVNLIIIPGFRILYDGNTATGGAVPIDPSYHKANDSVTIKGNTGSLVKTGCVFSGWNTKADGSGKTYAPGQSVIIDSADVTLFAKWTINKYTVTFNSQGGSAVKGDTVKHGSTVAKPSAPTKPGCSFVGWFKDSLYKDEWLFSSDTVIGAIVLYAKWIQTIDTQYTVTFISQGGSPVKSQTVKCGAPATKPSPDPMKDGYTFEGWFKDSLYTSEWSFTGDMIIADITLYAKWTSNVLPPKYAITFNSNGGSAVKSDSVYAGGVVKKPADPTKEGFGFGGWFKDSACTKAWNFLGDVVSGDATLYAKWTANLFTVTFNSNGGSEVPPQTVSFGNKVTKPANPTKSGYDFVGWCKDSLGTTEWQFTTDTVIANITLYAKWTLIPVYMVIYNGNGSNAGSAPVDTVKYKQGAVVTVKGNSGNLTKTGYTFAGWNTKADTSGKSYIAADTMLMGTAEVRLHAKWRIFTYSITYNNLDNATNTDNPKSYTIESNTIKLKPAKKNGYDFSGWYLEQGYVTKADSIPKGSSGEKAYYARWTPIAYSITYFPNGGTYPEATAPKSYTIETTTFDLPDATKDAFFFDGWYLDSSYSGAPLVKILKGSTGNLALYAKWVIKDINGNKYTAVTIGNQVWMAENFRATKFNDGTIISYPMADTEWTVNKFPAYCWYNNDTANKSRYGALYNWKAVVDSKNLAPEGWHVPTITEWDILINYLIANGYNWDGTKADNKVAKAMAAKTNWKPSTVPGAIGANPGQNNKSGFSALPGGHRAPNSGEFQSIDSIGIWWSSTEGLAQFSVREISLTSSSAGSSSGTVHVAGGCSVRLLKN